MAESEVLILADNKQTVKSLTTSLEKLNYKLSGVTNNKTDALKLTASIRPDIIIIDTKLNEFEDGIEAARAITGLFNIPHIFISSETDEETIERSKATHPYGFLLKPVDIRDLNACMRLALFRFESEKRLKESEERYFRLAEHAKDMIFSISFPNNNYEYINNACIDITGYSPKEFYQKPGLLNNIVHPDNKKAFDEYLEKIIKGKAPSYFEFMVIHKSGEIRWLNMRNVLLKNDKDIPEVIEGIVTDISEQKRYEELLTEQKEGYKLIFEAIPAMVIVKDLQNKIIRINKKAAEFIGYPINLMEGRNIADFFPSRAEKYLWEDQQVAASGSPVYGIIEENTTQNGEINIISYDKYPYYDIKGRITGIIVLAKNITQEKTAERKLIDTEHKNSELIKTIPDILFEYDINGRHMDYRASKPENLYTTPDNFMDKTVTEILPASVSGNYMEALKKAHQTGEMQILEYTLPINNTEKDFEARFIKSGPERIMAIIRDITVRKASEEAIKQSLQEKEILLKEIHHRVKNNLQIVSSLLKLQSKYVTDKDALLLLKESQNRVQSMSLIHQKLYQTRDFAHIEFQDYIYTVTMHLQHSFGVLGDRVRVIIEAQGIIMSIDDAIPAGLIINELVSNSLKYAFPGDRKGEIFIMVAVDRFKGDYWLCVRDNGIGLPDDIKSKKSGSFGLNLVDMLVGQMGGSIEVVNKGGLEFRINFKSSEYVQRA